MDTLSQREAKLRYGPSRFDVLVPGTYVKCAVTGARIPLEDLRYWSVERQEPYATPDAALKATKAVAKPRS